MPVKTDLIFIAGNSRSGTTLMGRILQQHADIHTFHELHFFEQLWSAGDAGKVLTREAATVLYARLLRAERAGVFSNAAYQTYEGEAAQQLMAYTGALTGEAVFGYFLQQEAGRQGKSMACEQTPRNLFYGREITQLYPDAKMIVMVRDPRDVLLSQKRKWKRRFLGGSTLPWRESLRAWVNYHPITISRLWAIHYQTVETLLRDPAVLVVSFEQLLAEPRRTLQMVCSFVGIDYAPALLEVPQVGSSHQADRTTLGIAPAHAGWRAGGLTASELFLCQRLCRAEMKRAGYALVPCAAPVLRLLWDALSFPVKLVLAFGLNIHRMKNMGESLSRRFRTVRT